MRLYYAPNTISVAVAIALHEAELAFEPVLVNFQHAAQTKADYLSINPKGRVPTLETGGALLTETGALLEFVASSAPAAGLTPKDPLEAAHMRGVMYFVASTMHVNHAHKMRGTRWAQNPESHADMAAKVPANMTENAQYIQAHCLRGDFVLGARFSLADPYLFVICCWLEGDGVDLATVPAVKAYIERMRGRASVKRVTEQGMLTV